MKKAGQRRGEPGEKSSAGRGGAGGEASSGTPSWHAALPLPSGKHLAPLLSDFKVCV